MEIMEETINIGEFNTLDENDIMEVEGGGAILVGCAIVGFAGLFGLEIYNGYKDTQDQKK